MVNTACTSYRWEYKLGQTQVTSKHQHEQLSILKAAAKLLPCLLHHFLSNLHSLLLLHKEELAYVPSPLTAGREAEGTYGKCSPQVNMTVTAKDWTVCLCVSTPLLAFLSSRHQRRWSSQHSGSGCGLMMSSLIHHCLTGWSGWTGTLWCGHACRSVFHLTFTTDNTYSSFD